MTKKLTLVADGVPVATPTDLGASGAELWRAITSEYDIADIGGRTLLAQLCKAHDRAESCRAAIERDGELVVTRGGSKEHPLIRAELQNRAFICRTLMRLGISYEPVKPIGRPGRDQHWKG